VSSSAPLSPDQGHVADRQLAIALCEQSPGETDGRQLLLGFRFGPGSPPHPHPALVNTGIDPVGNTDLYECWWYDGPVDYFEVGQCRVAESDDFAAFVVQVPDAGSGDFRALARVVYTQLLEAVKQVGDLHIARIWNYFSDINKGEGDREKYRQFSIGRAEAFDTFGLGDLLVPAATAVGSPRACDFTVIALASRHSFRAIENPRQVSAFRYPKDYGPKSPKFSRGGCLVAGHQSLQLISGTAAIIGHESVHEGDTTLQCEETFRNLELLCNAMSQVGEGNSRVELDRDAVLRVYLRDPADRDEVEAGLQDFLGDSSRSVAFLNADICRRELQVEVEAVRVVSAPR
jgi:chorismate lyase/3-hydroxybenzoate synthase